jgi:foldase protein PrsA
VNKDIITLLELEEAVEEFAKISNITINKDLEKEILNQLINEKLILQEAKRQKIFIDPFEVEKIMEDIKSKLREEDFKSILKKRNITEEKLKKEYEDNLLKMKIIDKEVRSKVNIDERKIRERLENYKYKIRASHILVKNRREAEEILKKIDKGEDFEELAKKYSLCPSKKRGGDLGFFTKGQMVSAFEEASFSLSKGEISEIIKTKFGYHIIRLEEKKKLTDKELMKIREKIEKELFEEEYQKRMERWLNSLRENSFIEILL